MNPVAALLILNMTCADPVLTFREFYSRTTIMPFPGMQGEEYHIVYERLANLAGDYVEYRAVRAATCGPAK